MVVDYKEMEIKALLIHPLTPYYIAWRDGALSYRLMNGDGHYGGDIQHLLMRNLAAAVDYDRIAMNNLGCMFYSGIGVQRNERKAREYLEAAARLGTNVALVNLGSIAEDHENYEEAFSYYKRAYDRDDAIGQWYCAGMLREGRGTDQDDAAAYQCYDELVGMNFAPAYWPRGCMERDGIGTEQNEDAAIWSFFVGAQKCPYCATEYARYVQKGIYESNWVDRSEKYIRRVIALGAALGDPRAYGDLGRAFELGQNVPRDRNNAVICYQCGAALGDPVCVDAIRRILPSEGTVDTGVYVRSQEICDILRDLDVGDIEVYRDNGLAGCVAHLLRSSDDDSYAPLLDDPETQYENDDNVDGEDCEVVGTMDAANAARRSLETSMHQYHMTPNRDTRREVYRSIFRCIRADGRVLVPALGEDLLDRDAEIVPVVTTGAEGQRRISVITNIDEVKRDATLGYCALMPLRRLLLELASNEDVDALVVNPLSDAYSITRETVIHFARILEDTGYDRAEWSDNDQPYGHSLFHAKRYTESYLPMWAARSVCQFLRAHAIRYRIENSWNFSYYGLHNDREEYLKEVRKYQNIIELRARVLGGELMDIAEETLFMPEEMLAGAHILPSAWRKNGRPYTLEDAIADGKSEQDLREMGFYEQVPAQAEDADTSSAIMVAGYYLPYDHFGIIATPDGLFVENHWNCNWQYVPCGGCLGYGDQLLAADIQRLIQHGRMGVFELEPENEEPGEETFRIDIYAPVAYAGFPAVQMRRNAEECGRDLEIKDISRQSDAERLANASVLTLEQQVEFAVNTGLINPDGPKLMDGKPQPGYTAEDLDDAFIDAIESHGALDIWHVLGDAQQLIRILESVQDNPEDLKDYYTWKAFKEAMFHIKQLPCSVADIFYWLGRVGDLNPHGWHTTPSRYEELRENAAAEAVDSDEESDIAGEYE